MTNPRCLNASRGDSFLCLRNALCISLALHLFVMVLPVLERVQYSGLASTKRMSVALVRKDIPEVPVVLAAADRPAVKSLPGHAGEGAVQPSLRSTPGKPGKRKRAAQQEISGADEFSVLPDGADVAAYRLALGYSASRLIAAASVRVTASGDVTFVLHGQPGQAHPRLFLTNHSIALESAESLLEIMRIAVEQTPLPAGWSGRRFRLSLRLQVVPIQSASGSG